MPCHLLRIPESLDPKLFGSASVSLISVLQLGQVMVGSVIGDPHRCTDTC